MTELLASVQTRSRWHRSLFSRICALITKCIRLIDIKLSFSLFDQEFRSWIKPRNHKQKSHSFGPPFESSPQKILQNLPVNHASPSHLLILQRNTEAAVQKKKKFPVNFLSCCGLVLQSWFRPRPPSFPLSEIQTSTQRLTLREPQSRFQSAAVMCLVFFSHELIYSE